jgi:thiamine-phosphate pyrophosphorylase
VRGPLPLIFLPDPRPGGGRTLEETARGALRGGASSIQLRAKDWAFDELVEAGGSLGTVCREFGRPLFINDRADVAAACGADGLHLGPGDLPPREARRLLGPEVLIGVSVYGSGDLAAAEEADAAYVALGAIFPTATKKIDVVGLEGLRRLRKQTDLPIVAIGGITAATAASVTAAGADGVAVVSALSGAADIESAARRFRRIIDEALERRSRNGVR